MEESDGEETEGAQENARTFSWKRSKSRNIVRRLNPMRIECAKHEICKLVLPKHICFSNFIFQHSWQESCFAKNSELSITEVLLKKASLSPILFVNVVLLYSIFNFPLFLSEVILSRFWVGCESVCGIEFQYRDFSLLVIWKQARKPRSYASLKLQPTHLLTYLLTRVKCRATSVARKIGWQNMQTAPLSFVSTI